MSKNHELRSGLKWTVNECLRLEREYDLLKLSVDEIALLHQRSPYAIMYKLDSEGIADFNDIYQQTYPTEASNDDSESEVDDDEESYQDQVQELEEGSGDDESIEDESIEEEYDKYDLKKHVQMLTKQVSNLTAIVYKSFIKDSRTGNVLFH